jgi:ABC-type phosphate transport system substrate-binding protein
MSLCAFATATATAAAGFKVVANASVAVDRLPRAEASRIFMKKQTKWKDGSPILPVDQSLSSDVREEFSKDVHGKNAAAVDAYWQKQIFSGRGLPPVTKSSDADVISYVRANAGAIGYVSAGADTTGVKVIAIQ